MVSRRPELQQLLSDKYLWAEESQETGRAAKEWRNGLFEYTILWFLLVYFHFGDK